MIANDALADYLAVLVGSEQQRDEDQRRPGAKRLQAVP